MRSLGDAESKWWRGMFYLFISRFRNLGKGVWYVKQTTRRTFIE